MYKILLVEDEKLVRDFIITYFSKREIEIVEATNGYEALEKLEKSFDLILLDIMMPGIDGYEVCKQIRNTKQTPIIFISALSQDEDQLLAYDIGADDYITKPFKPSLLYAKCIALIKRDKKEEVKKAIGKIILHPLTHHIEIQDSYIKLSHKEYQLLEYLIKNQGHILSRQQILDTIWGYDYYGDARAVDTYIKKLRKQLGKYHYYIQTIVKSGYVFEVKEE